MLDGLSPPVRRLLARLRTERGLSLDSLINDAWPRDPQLRAIYEAMTADQRLELHALVGFVLHETIHQVDLLSSPFGLSYLTLLVEEYLTLQSLVPRLLDSPDYGEAFPLLDHVGKSIPGVITASGLQAPWLHLEAIIRKAIAWGDIGGRTPRRDEITSGWEKEFAVTSDFFNTSLRVEPVRIFDFSSWTFRREGETNRCLTPTTILETKALAGTMLYLLSIAPDIRDVSRHFEEVYGRDRESLELDYLLVLDVIAEHHGASDIGDVLANGSEEKIRSVLHVAQSICWFALQSPPVVGRADDPGRGPSLAGNPVVRLFAALFCYGRVLAEWEPGLPVTGAAVMAAVERHLIFQGLDQMPMAKVHDRCIEACQVLEGRISGIWHPEVAEHLRRRLAMLRNSIVLNGSDYGSHRGQPENGNPRPHAGENIEIFFHDLGPIGGYAEWLDLRDQTLFSHVAPDSGWIDRLHAHFLSPMAIVPCDYCGDVHGIFVSRFADDHVVACPSTGGRIRIPAGRSQHIQIVPEE